MKYGYKTAIVLGALAACLISGRAQAFSFYFDENGNAHSDTGAPAQWAMTVDPNTGMTALTYLLPNPITEGIVDIKDIGGSLSDALSFYNIGDFGYMAYYSFDSAGDLADIGSAPGIFLNQFVGATENADGNFEWHPVGNDYYGVSREENVPDGGSTLAMLGGALALVGSVSRKLRK